MLGNYFIQRFRSTLLLIGTSAGLLIACSFNSTHPTIPEDTSTTALFDLTFSGRRINNTKGAPLVELQNGILSYGFYAQRGQTRARNSLPDFSHAGYMGGGVALPDYDSLKIKETLEPISGDAFPRIQKAIDRVAKLDPDARGIRGVILLAPGKYELSETLKIDMSGIVLRGSGQGKQGTRLVAVSTLPKGKASVLKIGKKEGRNRYKENGPALARDPAKTLITNEYLGVGATGINVASVEGYAIGDEISVVRSPNQYWLGKQGIDTAQFGWEPKGYTISFSRKIIDIQDHTLIVDIPLVDAIEKRFGGGRVQRIDTSTRVQQVGVENLRIETLHRDELSDLNRAFYGITLMGIENSWVRDVTVSVVSQGYNITNNSRFNTLQDIAFVDPNFEVRGGHHYGFLINSGEMNLFQRCYGRKARHTFITGSRVPGPNVFLDCTATAVDNDSGPHHRWATGTLYDNTQGKELNVQNRKHSGTGHGWAGAQNMFWNTEHTRNIVEAPPHAMNWAVGLSGQLKDGKWINESNGIIERKGKPVLPRSLYLQQLEERLSIQAVHNVTIRAQRQGRIWTLLKSWRGEHRLGDP